MSLYTIPVYKVSLHEIVVFITESIFKSQWLVSPAEWEQPELSKKMELLRSITSLSNKALENARISKFIRSSLEAEITVHTSKPILSELMTLSQQNNGGLEFSLSDYFIVSMVNVSGEPHAIGKGCNEGIFSERDTVVWYGEEYAVEVVAGPVSKTFGLDKCPRCWKWTCPEGEELCRRCEAVESKTLSTQEN